MSIESILIEDAKYQADCLQNAVLTLQTELKHIEKRKVEIDAKLQTVRRAHQRALDFRPSIGADFQCPRCWVEKALRSTLRPVGSDPRLNILRCGTCCAEFTATSS